MNVYGLVAGIPGVEAVGASDPQGKAITSQDVPGPTFVQVKVALVAFTPETTKAVGLGHAGGGAHVTLACHPACCTLPSLRNWKVKHPSALVEVNGPGIVAPQYPPANPPGTNPAPLVEAI